MCEFISWIEVDGKVLFLTDADVYDKRGREVFADSLDNDVLGHSAIRHYYGIRRGVGVEREERDFWKATLPATIAEKVATVEEFLRHWGRMWQSGVFQNDDLCCLIAYAPEPYKTKAWEQLLEQEPPSHTPRSNHHGDIPIQADSLMEISTPFRNESPGNRITGHYGWSCK